VFAIALGYKVGAQAHQLTQRLLRFGRGLPARQLGVALSPVAGEPSGVQGVGLAMTAQRAQEGADLARIAAMDGQTKGHGGGQQGGFIAAGGFADQQRVAPELAEHAGQDLDGVLHRLGGGSEAVEDDDAVLADVTAEDARTGGVFAQRAVSSFMLVIVCGRRTLRWSPELGQMC
jgi:hypothetical protein